MFKYHTSKSRYFLFEMMIAILFFSIASSLCLRFFTKAHLLSQSAADLNFAIFQVESVMEILNTAPTEDTLLSKAFPDADILSNGADIYYDKDHQPCDSQNSAYTLHVIKTIDGSMCRISLNMIAGSTSVYTLDHTIHIPLHASESGR